MATLLKIVLVFVSFLGLASPTLYASFSISKSIFDSMNYGEVLEITIEADVASLKNNRRTTEYQVAYLSFENEKEEQESWKIKLRPRGKFRRKMCEMPPLKIKFKKAELAVAGLNEFNDMKLVTHCVENKAAAKKLLMKEYLAYQIYETLTPNSYRTQLVKITYLDLKTGEKSKNWGFLIEDTAQLANRMQAEKCDCWGSVPSDFQHGTLELMALFQYMIGNEDYKVEDLRNIKIFKKDGQLIPVPYDFDFSGLVNAPYARASQKYQLKRVTDRVYLGDAENLQAVHCSQMLFFVKRQEIIGIVTNFKKLDSTTKTEMTNYLDGFFENIDTLKIPKNKLLDDDKKTLLSNQ